MQRSKTFSKYRSFPDKMFAERSHDNVSGGPVRIAITVAQLYLVHMLQPTLPTGFIAACLPTKTDKLPSGSQWLHEIKHDGFRIIARKTGAQVRLWQ